ncbi:MAG TPA: PKD domain-containing protein, partial [Saprospiraceae bacterium]|nr:PKD domain-containing protein [Saprospiraceae bacterium]
MKKCNLVYLVLGMFLLCLNNSYSQSADITKACAPIKIKFTAPPGFSNWFWDFKDGGSSNLENPEHIYTNPGIYTVEFRESLGGTSVGSIIINILPKPNVNVIVDPTSGCIPLDVTITDGTQYSPEMNILSKNWVFGDGGFGSGDIVNHTYLKPGLKDLSLEVKTDLPGCDFTQIFPDKINVISIPVPIIKTNPDPPSSCEVPFIVSFTENSTGNGPFTYNWNFGNGNTSILGVPPSQTYTSAGTYTVKFNITDKNGCSHDTSFNVSVGIPNVNISFPDTVCTNFVIGFDNKSSAGNHKWDFGPGAFPATSNIRSPNVKFTVPGLQKVHYTLSTNGGKCLTDTILYIYVFKFADALAIDYDQEDCKSPIPIQMNYKGDISSIKTINWQFGKFDTSTLVNPLFIYKKDKYDFSVYGVRNVKVSLYVNSAGCIADTMFNLPIDLLTACYTADTFHGCIPFTVNFKDCSY